MADDTLKPKIAVFAGPNATILNSEPLVTSNAARLRAGLAPLPFDAVRPQRLAAPVTVLRGAVLGTPAGVGCRWPVRTA